MTRELSKTEKALRLIAKEGITAKEAAERVGISPAAVSKGRLWPSKAAQNVRKLCEMENEIEFLRSELATLTRQRDLAVNALECIAGRRIFIDNLANNVDIAVMTLDVIKGSEK